MIPRLTLTRVMNDLQVTYSVERYTEGVESSSLLVPDISIDGEPLLESFTLDLRELAASARCSGDFWIFICGCGSPGCGGIERPVIVTHCGEETRWKVPHPIRRSSPRSDRFRKFTFDGRQYLAAVKAAITQVQTVNPSAFP